MADTDTLSDLEILACTLVGESESLGEDGMTGTALTIVNRVRANLHWLGGYSVRGVCLQPQQYDCWNAGDNTDRSRILEIAQNNPIYGPYVLAQRIAGDAIAGRLVDFTNGAVSYYDPPADPYWAKGKTPCFIDGKRQYFDLRAVTTKLPS